MIPRTLAALARFSALLRRPRRTHGRGRVPLYMIAGIVAVALAVLGGAALARADGQNGTTLSETITGTGHLTKTFHWAIDKSVSPSTWNLFNGDTGTSTYTVAVTKDDGTLAAYIDGQICVTNGGSVDTQGLTITANVDMPPDFTILASASVDVSAHPVIAAGETWCYNYHVDIPSPVAGGGYRVTADTTITNHSGCLSPAPACGPDEKVDVSLPTTPTLINDTIHVTDTNGGSWTFSASGSVSYTKTFTCAGDQGTHNNTATITETSQSSSASVTVNCYALGVTKSASTSFTRTYLWSILKTADQTSLTLALGQSFTVNYAVQVSATYADSNEAVSGTVSVHNPAPIDATLNSLSDVITPPLAGIAVTLNCPVSFPYTLPAGATLVCSYSQGLPDETTRTNTATATQQNYDYASDGSRTPGGVTNTSGTASVDFSNASVTYVDPSITVNDTLEGFLGTATVGSDTLPKTFTYSLPVGPYSVCGQYMVKNTATFTTSDTHATGSSSWTVTINVPCNAGCTLTIGYWKNHAGFTGNNPDMVTPLLPINLGTAGGMKTVTITTAAQAVQYLTVSGKASNGVIKLYAQLLGAKLNIASGANGSAVASTIAAADAFLANHDATSWPTLSKAQQAVVLGWMTTLDNYNNGLIGPSHCSQ